VICAVVSPLTEVVTQSGSAGIYIGVAAVRAGVGDVAVLSTCGRCLNSHIVMTLRGDHFSLYKSAVGTGGGSAAVFRSGCRDLDHCEVVSRSLGGVAVCAMPDVGFVVQTLPCAEGVTGCRCAGLCVGIAAACTGEGGIACFCTCGFGYDGGVVVSQSRMVSSSFVRRRTG
jgi:hypothetical protein